MALITDLPEEVIMMIVRRLDFSSQCSIYNACDIFRNILSLPGVILTCNLSLSTFATVNTLKLNFFSAISNHLQELDMRGVPDLTKTKVLPAFKKLKHLKVLDISYTNLNILDLVAIHCVCPTLKDITVDFKFGQTSVLIAEDTLLKCQSLFEHFQKVHFVGALCNLLFSKVVLHILKKSKLDTLRFSVVELDTVSNAFTTHTNSNECEIPHFSHFAAFWLTNWRSKRMFESINNFPVISMIPFENYEFCIIYTPDRHVPSVYASPIFKDFFSKNFNVNIQCQTAYENDRKGNLALMLWNRETTQFDDLFFKKLYDRVKQCFPFYYEALSDVSCPQNYDWIYTKPRPIEVTNQSEEVSERKRIASMLNVILDYDNLLKDKLKAQLTLVFLPNQIVSASLPSNGQYFSKITFLSLGGYVKYNTDFFLHLFESCHNLVTLSVEIAAIAACRTSYDILHAMKVSRSLKNIRLIDKGMDFKQFFDLLSRCKTLENISLVDTKQWDFCPIGDPTLLVTSCANLYSVYIEAPYFVTAIPKQLQSFNKIKTTLNRHHLRVVLKEVSSNTFIYGYDPFLDVFKLNSIKPM